MCEASERICRICRGGEADECNDEDGCAKRFEPLLSPCNCKGSCALVHGPCILAWIASQASLSSSCEVCHSRYKLKWRPKPIRSWRSPTFSEDDRWKLRMSLVSCLLTIADMVFCATSITNRTTYIFASPTLHALLLITLTMSWTYCIGVNLCFWLSLIQRWRRQNLELSI